MPKSQTTALVNTLKIALKQAGLTYSDVALGIGMSEANVKRLFSTHSFSLERLESICDLIHFTITDLVQMLEESQQRVSQLSKQQEQALIEDQHLLLVAVCARNHWKLSDITNRYQLTEPECIKLLIKLDHLGVIELMPNNRIRLLVAEDFQWIPNGPIERYFEAEIQNEFLDARFNANNEYRQYLGGALSNASAEIIIRKLQLLTKEFTALQQADAHLTINDKQNIGMVVALRPWELSAFKNLKKSHSS